MDTFWLLWGGKKNDFIYSPLHKYLDTAEFSTDDYSLEEAYKGGRLKKE